MSMGYPFWWSEPAHMACRLELILPADEVLVQNVVSMEPGVDAKGWFDWYKKALTPLAPGVYQLIVHLAYDDDEMRGATWDHPTGALPGVNKISIW